jgi:hypothetical protein
MAVTNRNYGFQKKLQLFIEFPFIYLNDLKNFEPKNTLPSPTNQPINQTTNQDGPAV